MEQDINTMPNEEIIEGEGFTIHSTQEEVNINEPENMDIPNMDIPPMNGMGGMSGMFGGMGMGMGGFMNPGMGEENTIQNNENPNPNENFNNPRFFAGEWINDPDLLKILNNDKMNGYNQLVENIEVLNNNLNMVIDTVNAQIDITEIQKNDILYLNFKIYKIRRFFGLTIGILITVIVILGVLLSK